MPIYANADELYACLQTLFDRVQEEDPSAAKAILASRLVIRLRCTVPSAEVTLNGRHRSVQTSIGPSPLRPDLDVALDADTLHLVLLGELPLKKAVAAGRLKVRGPVWKTFALADLFRRGQAIYPQVLREQGLAPPSNERRDPRTGQGDLGSLISRTPKS